ncbi:MAG TPA: hypothetical protein VMG62_03490 [Solirubrobacteraceae bacterium]|nr:hypothetical protein [Solirubrobacteraceae bacterium]
MGLAERVLGSVKNAILAVAALILAVGTIWGAAKHLLSPAHQAKTAATPVARFEEARLNPGVPLEQYEVEYAPTALASLQVTGESGEGATTSPGAGASVQGKTTAEQPQGGEKAAGGEKTTGGERTTGGEITTGGQSTTGGEATTTTGTPEAAAKAREAKEREEARGKQEEREHAEAKRRRAEEAAEAREAREEEARAQRKSPHRSTVPGHGGRDVPGYRAFVEPVAPARSFHREGQARVAVGTGESTGEVDAVLREAAAILAAEGQRPQRLDHGSDRRRAAVLLSSDVGAPRRESVEAPGTSVVVPGGCGEGCALRPTIEQAIRDYSSNLTKAAHEIAAIFTDTRFEDFEHRREQVGAEVHYRFDLSGYRGKLVNVVWTLWSRSTGRPPPRSWWRNVIVKQVVPTSEDAHVKGQFWAPSPQKPGDYYFKLTLYAPDGEEIEQTETASFH